MNDRSSNSIINGLIYQLTAKKNASRFSGEESILIMELLQEMNKYAKFAIA